MIQMWNRYKELKMLKIDYTDKVIKIQDINNRYDIIFLFRTTI